MDSNGLGAYERTKAALVNVVTNALKDMGYDVEEKHDEATGRRWWRGKKKGEESFLWLFTLPQGSSTVYVCALAPAEVYLKLTEVGDSEVFGVGRTKLCGPKDEKHPERQLEVSRARAQKAWRELGGRGSFPEDDRCFRVGLDGRMAASVVEESERQARLAIEKEEARLLEYMIGMGLVGLHMVGEYGQEAADKAIASAEAVVRSLRGR